MLEINYKTNLLVLQPTFSIQIFRQVQPTNFCHTRGARENDLRGRRASWQGWLSQGLLARLAVTRFAGTRFAGKLPFIERKLEPIPIVPHPISKTDFFSH